MKMRRIHMTYYRPETETMKRDDLDSLIDERVRYTVRYASENSPFYQKWFKNHKIDPKSIREHEDLAELPIIDGKTIREFQPPVADQFYFKSAPWNDIFTIHETSGTSGTPKSFFLMWDDWERYAEKYARAFVSQGFGAGDRVAVCASYGMNVGANTMTLAAHNIGFTVIPEGKCTFPVRFIHNYHPTAIIGSVFKLLRLAERLKGEGIDPKESGLKKLVVGGESFAEEARAYLDEVWGIPAYNTYGSTEGTMCGECSVRNGLHVPEDLVHVDIYDPKLKHFVPDGKSGRIVLTTLIPEGERSGNLLINYDTEDVTEVISRDVCTCGRTHMRVKNPIREAETVYINAIPVNRVDIEKGVFQRENMEYLSGEYEAFVYSDEDSTNVAMRVSLESRNPETCDRKLVEENFLSAFFKKNPALSPLYTDGALDILFHFAPRGDLELHRLKGRPKRLVDRRS